MKCNPLRWLWGVIPVALLGWFATQLEHTRIERDIEGRVLEQLSGSGMKWARTGVWGRDIIVSGQATDEADPGRAVDIARSIWGVRTVENGAALAEKVDKYLWGAQRSGNQVRLTGFVPNEAIRANVVASARAAFAGADIADEMKIARGSPNADTWLTAVNFSLKQLAGLKSGKSSLDGLALSVDGSAESTTTYRNIKSALASNMPRGVRLSDERVVPPAVSPYTWSALSADSKLTLLGHVPSETVRVEILTAAKAAFPRAAVTDRMEPASGAVAGHAVAAVEGLRALAQLEEGEASVLNNRLNLEGMAPSEQTATAVKANLRRAAPQGFVVGDAVRFRDTGPPRVSPYTTSADISAVAVVLTGFAPSDAAKQAMGDLARTRFPGRTIDNRLQLASGAPEGWQRCLDAGFGGIARLGGGRLAATDQRLDLTSSTDDAVLAGRVPEELRAAAGRDCDANAKIELRVAAPAPVVVPPAPPPAVVAPPPAPVVVAPPPPAPAPAPVVAAPPPPPPVAVAPPTPPPPRAPLVDPRAKLCEDSLRAAAREGMIRFTRASAELSRDSRPTLERLAAAARACPNVRIEIEGHTDNEGTDERNQRLSDRRASAIVDYLVRANVPASKLTAIGYGATRPLVPNDGADGRAKNRRIEFTVSEQK